MGVSGEETWSRVQFHRITRVANQKLIKLILASPKNLAEKKLKNEPVGFKAGVLT